MVKVAHFNDRAGVPDDELLEEELDEEELEEELEDEELEDEELEDEELLELDEELAKLGHAPF